MASRETVREVAVIDVPSGQPLELLEVLIDEIDTTIWVRFRFLAPQIARETGTVSFDAAQADFEALCEHVALPYLLEYALSPDLVSVTLLDRPVAFGASDQDATQFVEVFRLQDGACIWEGL
ncbi:MAG: hypothetical protein HC814_02110 [Rhodobacteraceae bacterium]|nr:hypothetical protein [Paracoccaceae bacterium]